jgi:hypothetical protein
MEVNMAEKTKQANNDAKRVTVKLPRNNGQNANQDEFFSVNFKNYIIRRGERVEIPEALAEIIENNEKADDYAMKFVEEHGFNDAK